MMNARQTKKRLKKKIDKLKSDCSKLEKRYNTWIKPPNITYTKLPIQKFITKKVISAKETDNYKNIEYIKLEIAEELFEVIKDNIIYEIDDEGWLTTVTGSIFIGRESDGT